MTPIANAWGSLRETLLEHGAELRLCLRMTLAATLSLAVSHLLNLPLALWTVLTAVILTQMSVGRSLKATMDYLIATVGGAAYAGAVGALFRTTAKLRCWERLRSRWRLRRCWRRQIRASAPRRSRPSWCSGPLHHPYGSDRVRDRARHRGRNRRLHRARGVVAGAAGRAHDLAIEGSANLLGLIRRLLPELFAGFSHGLDEQALRHMQNSIGAAFVQLDAVAAEARHERMTRLAAEPDQGPLLRTLLRLRHDLVMIGRAALEPLPEPFRTRLGPWLARIAETADDFLRDSAAALLVRRNPPPLDAVAAALDRFATEMAALRREGLTRTLPLECVERIFALGFALDQMHRNLNDLARCVAESAQPRTTRPALAPGAEP